MFSVFYITYLCVCADRSVVSLCDPMVCPWNSPGENTGLGCHSLLQGIFLTQGWNPGLLHCWQILYHMSHQESPHYILSPYLFYTWKCLPFWLPSSYFPFSYPILTFGNQKSDLFFCEFACLFGFWSIIDLLHYVSSLTLHNDSIFLEISKWPLS